MKLTRLLLLALGWLSAATFAPGALAADGWPSKPIKFIVPYAAGGSGDITVRLLAQQMSVSLGQSVVVENRTGAGGNIGTDFVAKSPPDGYTMVLAYVGPMSINPFLYKNLPFQPLKDFAPVAQVAEAPLVLVANSAVPAKTVGELISLAKANPNKYFCGSSGIGGADHLACELFKSRTGAAISTIAYKGGAPAVVDLVAGRTHIQFATIPGIIGHSRTGAVRPLAILSSKRFALLGDVPTMAEAGIPSFDINNWYGVSVPAGTPPEVIKRLSGELNAILQQPQVRARLLELGLVPTWTSTEEFTSLVKAEFVRWEPIVRASGATVD